MGSMKVHQFSRGFINWPEHHHPPPSLSLSCKRLRPLTPGSPTGSATSSFDLKSFIRPDNDPKLASSDVYTTPKASPNHPTPQVESHPGGTRWNPTQEQIGILEMLYRGGMRTPNAQQIEHITVQLSKYGKIEGKNVFYWFQNHKARERQKQKRNGLGLSPSPTTCTSLLTLDTRVEMRGDEISYKRKSRSWGFEWLEEEGRTSWKDEGDGTLELFPLHPEGR